MAQAKNTDLNIRVNVQDKFSQGFKKLTGNLQNTADKLDSFGKKASLAITAPMILAGGFAIKAAADAEEMENRFQAVFGNLADSSAEFADELGNAVGRSTIKIKDGLSVFQSFAVGMGFSRDQAQNLSESLSTLTFDFASFNNISDGEAQQRFISALSGSSEVLDRFGINIKQSALDIELQAQGLANSTVEATEQQKVIARLAIIMRAMTDQGAVGDAIRTQDSFTNQMKRLNDAFFDFKVQLGRDIIPAITGLVTSAGQALESFNNLNPSVRKAILVFATFLATVGPAAFILGNAVKAFYALRTAIVAVRTASLALLGPWGLVAAAAATVAGVVGIKLFKSVDKTSAASADLEQQLKDLAPSFDAASLSGGGFTKSLDNIKAQAKETADSIKKLNEQAADIFSSIAEDEASDKKDLAEAIIDQEEKVSDIKTQIRDLQSQERKAEDRDAKKSIQERLVVLQQNLEAEQQALRNAANLRKGLRVEIQEAERRADLTDFERMVEDIQRRRIKRLQDQLLRLQEIKAEIAAEEKKNTAIQQSYATAQKNIRNQAAETSEFVIEEANKQRKAFDRVIAKMDMLGGHGNSTSAFRGIEGRAVGGPVTGGKPYIVGEKGPELFTPSSSGSIIPNNRLSGGTTIILTGNTFMSDEDAAEQIGDMIINRWRLSNAL